MVKQKYMINISICIIIFTSLLAGEQFKEAYLKEEASKQKTHKKYNEEEMENPEFITASAFDEWLKVNDHYEAFVKAYNRSSDHPYVKKIKCMFELDNLYDENIEFDILEEKCSNQK